MVERLGRLLLVGGGESGGVEAMSEVAGRIAKLGSAVVALKQVLHK